MSTPNIINWYVVTTCLNIKKNKDERLLSAKYIPYVFFIVIFKQYKYIKEEIKTSSILPSIFKQVNIQIDNLISRVLDGLLVLKVFGI